MKLVFPEFGSAFSAIGGAAPDCLHWSALLLRRHVSQGSARFGGNVPRTDARRSVGPRAVRGLQNVPWISRNSATLWYECISPAVVYPTDGPSSRSPIGL